MTVLVAILAAGESKRMGEPKLCLPWQGTTILGHVIAQWCEAGAKKIVVVLAPGENAVTRELDRLAVPASQRIVNHAMDRSMMGSVIAAASHALQDKTLSHLIISLGDQPQIRVETMRDLLLACASEPGKLIRVVHEGKSGHPLALPAGVLPDLSTTPAATLRDFLRLKESPARDLTSRDSGVLLDVDTPADYHRALRSTDSSPT